MMFPLSIRNLFYTWTSLRPWAQSLILGIPGWPLVILACIIAGTSNLLGREWYEAVLTSLFVVMWYGSVWAMGQQDIRNLTFKSGRAWFIAAIIVYLAGMVSVAISIPLLIAGIYTIYAWEQLIGSKKWRFMAIGLGTIIIAFIVSYLYPNKFALTDIAWALPVFVILLAPKQVDKFISWVYSAVSLGVAGFLAMSAIASSVPQKYQSGIITAIVIVTLGGVIWIKKSSHGKLANAAHQEKKAAAANSPTARKFRRVMFAVVMGLYVLLHGLLAIDAQGKGRVGAWLMAMLAAVFVYALWYRLSVYDKQHLADHEANGL